MSHHNGEVPLPGFRSSLQAHWNAVVVLFQPTEPNSPSDCSHSASSLSSSTHSLDLSSVNSALENINTSSQTAISVDNETQQKPNSLPSGANVASDPFSNSESASDITKPDLSIVVPSFRSDIPPLLVSTTFSSPVVKGSAFHNSETSWSAPLPEYPFSVLPSNLLVCGSDGLTVCTFSPSGVDLFPYSSCSVIGLQPNVLYITGINSATYYCVKFCVPLQLFIPDVSSHITNSWTTLRKASAVLHRQVLFTYLCPSFQIYHRNGTTQSFASPVDNSLIKCDI